MEAAEGEKGSRSARLDGLEHVFRALKHVLCEVWSGHKCRASSSPELTKWLALSGDGAGRTTRRARSTSKFLETDHTIP
eukprot:575505-Rhodomonas_salina.2